VAPELCGDQTQHRPPSRARSKRSGDSSANLTLILTRTTTCPPGRSPGGGRAGARRVRLPCVNWP